MFLLFNASDLMSEETPDFDSVNRALLRLNADIEAAELHGTLSGLLCVMGNNASKHLDQLIPKGAKGDVLDSEAYEMIINSPVQVLAALNDPEFGYALLLPRDDEGLDVRTQALAEWSHGFLSGLAIAGIEDFSKLPKEASEFCHDLGEIARAGLSDMELGEEDEAAFEELSEYLRVGVLLIYELLNPSSPASPSGQVH